MSSYCWQCEGLSTCDVGYAGSCKMVSSRVFCLRRALLLLSADRVGFTCFFDAHYLFFAPSSIRDAWAKHKDLGPYEAKWQYVEEVLRVSCFKGYQNWLGS